MSKFFVVHAGEPILYCELNGQSGGVIDASVINGAWDFKLDVKKGQMDFDAPSGHSTIFGCKVLQLHADRFGHDYNSALEWARTYLKKNRIFCWVDDKKFVCGEFLARFVRAKVVFVKVWNGQVLSGIADFDDDIFF